MKRCARKRAVLAESHLVGSLHRDRKPPTITDAAVNQLADRIDRDILRVEGGIDSPCRRLLISIYYFTC
jgi:hypothetical protein